MSHLPKGAFDRVTGPPQLSQEDFRAFQQFLEDACGIVLGENKEYLVSSRLRRILLDQGLDSYRSLLQQLMGGRNPQLRTQVVDAMTTNETFWFRDPPHYRILSDIIFQELDQNKSSSFRIWSAACSSGQEPYSLSMTVEDFRRSNPGRQFGRVEIVATDISTKVLAEAREGIYCGLATSRGLSDEHRRAYFHAHGDCLRVESEVRRRVVFRELNLGASYALLGRFDVVFCRNVLIYFSNEMKIDILQRISQSLNPGGYLFLGSTESITGVSHLYHMVSKHGGIAYRLKP